MPAFLVALMVVVLVVLGLTAVLLLSRTMRTEAAAVPRARGEDPDDAGGADESGHPDSEPSGPHPPRTEDD